MTFDEVLDQIRALLASKGRVTYRALKVRFDLNDESLAACTEELIEAERVAIDENGKVLVWVGASPVPSSQFHPIPSPQPLTPSTQAEECFLKAIDIAQKQQAKSLELHAVMSLVRLRQQ